MNVAIDTSKLYTLRDEVVMYGQAIAKEVAVTARNSLTQRYNEAIEFFYTHYEPVRYHRTWQLYNSYIPYYSNAHGTAYIGGVSISTANMLETHRLPNVTILSLALEGMHGYWAQTLPTPYDMTIQYRDAMVAFIDEWMPDVILRAQKAHVYRFIKF